MRFHKPVAPHEQPHLQSFFQGGIPADGRASPDSMAVSSGSYARGGTVGRSRGRARSSIPDYSVLPDNSQSMTDYMYKHGRPVVDELGNVTGHEYDLSNGIPSELEPAPIPPAPEGLGSGYDDGGTVSPNGYMQWPNQVQGQGYADGGTIDPYAAINNATAPSDDFEYGGKGIAAPTTWLDDTKLTTPTYATDSDTSSDSTKSSTSSTTGSKTTTATLPSSTGASSSSGSSSSSSGSSSTDTSSGDTGTSTADTATGSGYDSGGEVDPDRFVGQSDAPTNDHYEYGGGAKDLVAHTKSLYDSMQKYVEGLWRTEQGGSSATEPNAPSAGYADGGEVTGDGYAQGGGIPMPPGPAGPGVRPQPATGNAGRPGFVAKDPVQTSAQKNYAQNVTSRPATSPSKGTAYEQPAPDGGKRGQEWYGKGASPYGAGRKKQNG